MAFAMKDIFAVSLLAVECTCGLLYVCKEVAVNCRAWNKRGTISRTCHSTPSIFLNALLKPKINVAGLNIHPRSFSPFSMGTRKDFRFT